MAIVNTINFLPKVFRTPTNRRFLGATMDQLTADAVNTKVNGYVGRTFSPTYKTGDNYVPEQNTLRQNYQLEPSVVVTNSSGDVEFNTGYIDLLQNIKNYGGLIDNQQRLFSSEIYNFDGHFDYDKFVNYFNYYWLPTGPDTVLVYNNAVPYNTSYDVTKNTAVGGYTFTDTGYQPNTQLTLARGGTYTFTVDQLGSNFWIQSSPGVSGLDPNVPTVSTRDVFGVTNNGASVGTVTFRVPLYNAQDFYLLMPIMATVDAAVTLKYTDIQNRLLSDFLTEYPDGIDGINNQLQNKTLAFIGNDTDVSYWTTPAVDAEYTSLDIASIRPGDVISSSVRPSTWKINLVAIDSEASDYIIQISPDVTPVARQKVFVSSGKTYASNQFWLNDNLRYNLVPAITANKDVLYYQDSSNPGFVGEIRLVNNTTDTLNIDTEIIGKTGFTSYNGVVFTNGLKIQFDSLVTPASYYKFDYVNYTAWELALNAMGATITGSSTGAVAYKDERLVGEWDGEAGYRVREWYVEGVGTAINLVPVGQTTVPESYAYLLDTDADYITINRGSRDRNPWSRSNRWFHKDVITATATYNNSTINYGPNLPGRRPIIEFEPNLQLFNFGSLAKNSVDLVSFTESDAFGLTVDGTRVEGTPPGTQVDGVTLIPGQRVVFANDYDINVRNKIWEVTVIPGLVIDEEVSEYINLVETDDNPVVAGETVLVTQGSNTGKTFYFDGTDWFEAQDKTGLNQTPLFDLVDADGYSFSDATVYPSSAFVGNKIFGYYPGTGTNNDPILGFPLQYQNFNNIGDIVFKNYYETESFTYTSGTVNCRTGFLVQNSLDGTKTKLNSWVKGKEHSSQYQIFTKFFDGRVIDVDGVNRAFVQIDVLPADTNSIPHLKVYKNNELLVEGIDYTLTNYGIYNVIVFLTDPAVGDKLDVAVFADAVSKLAYYEVPVNLSQNPLNESFSTVALGQIRTHYNALLENTAPSGRPLQDSYLKQQNGILNQHSASLVYAMTFLNDNTVNFIKGIDLAKKEYSRFKNKFISLCSTLSGLDYTNPISGVDTILQSINSVKNNTFPWYYSDMVPQGGSYTTITYTVLNVRQTKYEISSIFNPTELSNRAILVWHNGVQLVLGLDYTFSATVPTIEFTTDFAIGDTILIRDYANTDGNYIPETPSKLGLYPKSEPTIFEDTTYQTPTNVIRGHDGSLMPAFGDFRDDFLLELEKRIYNNIKADYSKNIINLYDVIPGRFRTTEYSRDEFVQILSKNFLQWSGTNNVDYTTNEWYDANNPWTWNYEKFTDTVDDKPLQGSWRAIYNYWYDTDQPNLAPWEMLGLRFKPSWWETRYGSAPYTSGNFTLWEDLEAGYIWNNGDSYTDSRFVRPGLTNFIPVDSAGNLLPPPDINIIKQYNLTTAGNNYTVGEQGPVETAWRRSSDYPFAVQQAIALAKPASYFGTQYDTSKFYVNGVTGQFSSIDNIKITPSALTVNGDATSGTVLRTSGYINWIADSIKNVGIDPVEKINSYLKNLSVKLNYKVAGFTDKNILTVTAEQTTPGAVRAGVIIPDNNYDIYLNKSVPVSTATYSAVIVQKTVTGYSVVGYNTQDPFFTVLPSIANNNAELVTVDDASTKIYQDTTSSTALVPYGTTYATIQQLTDFLISYERYLESIGFIFNQFDPDLQEVRNFRTSVREFLYWSQQGWDVGTILVLNPVADKLLLKSSVAVVDEVANTRLSGHIMDQNFLPIKSTNFNIIRSDNAQNGNLFGVTTLNGTGICFAHLKLVQTEHVLIFDNESDFGDVIYVPGQGTRQYRLKLSGSKTGNWTGALNAAGYVYSTANIRNWEPHTDYQVGDIVVFNNNYYTAPKAIPSTTKFNVSSWVQIQESEIKTGLLPSFGLQAQQAESIYNVDQPPSNETLQLFSAGLIGFRPRSYLTDIGISVPNQTKFYQGLIKEKGTLNSITALTKGNFNNVSGNIALFEEWAFKVGEYGDLDGNQFKEFVLDQSVFTTNPVALTSAESYSTGNIIVNLNGNAASVSTDVYNSSNITNTTTTIYSNRNAGVYPTDLPTAGYVHVDDVDLTIFDINSYNQNPGADIGDKIWVAKDTINEWNVYRVTETNTLATQITYILDDYAQISFDSTHDLVAGDLFILSGFTVEYFNNVVLENYETNFDATYEVVEVVDTTTVTIQIKDTTVLNNLIATSPVVSEADVHKLVSSRVQTNANISAITPPDGWITNDRVWVDADTEPGATGWAVYTYDSGWTRTRQELPQVDLASANRLFIYNKSDNSIIAPLDIIDPVKGKILNSVALDIDYLVDYDPATYNQGTGTLQSDYHWGPQQVGRIWWNLDAVRYINYEQDALIYRLNHWGDQFPGSNVEIYEWVESTVLPSEYATAGNSGTPLHADNSSYSTYGYVDQAGAVRVKYYFWVTNIDQANTKAGKKNSVVAITSAIENPQNQDIPYATILSDDTLALYNIKNLLVGKNSVLHIGSQAQDAGLIHSEYALVQEKSPNSQLPQHIVEKLIDSLAAIDANGNAVPEAGLPVSQRYGVSIRPRQTMFINLPQALANLVSLVNSKLHTYPVTQRKVLTLLNSEESAPSIRTGEYDIVVATLDERDYINTSLIDSGYRVLVNSDSTVLDKWSIYEWDGADWAVPVRSDGTNWVQSYKTNRYWSYTDWYAEGFDPTATVDITVVDNLEFGKLTLTAGTHIKVLNAGNDKFAVYYIDANLNRVTVGLQDGTIQLPTPATGIPSRELRQILKALQTEIFIDDLAQDFNDVFFDMVKYALTEQKNIDWAFKTSFISATQYIRKLEQFPNYIADNQDFYQEYINEVKPYRTILREFNINYQRNDEFGGDITDFDLAPYWDSNINVYRSPSGEQSYDAGLLNNRVYYDWKHNYAYSVVDVVVGNGGTGFITAPEITIAGGGGTGATATAHITNGAVDLITVTNPGSGYTSTPTVIINGTGTGAIATAILRNVFNSNVTQRNTGDVGHNVIRSIKTNIKFDRLTYDWKKYTTQDTANSYSTANGLTSSYAAVMWDEVIAGQVLAPYTIINLNGDLYQVTEFQHTVNVNVDFPLANVTAITAGDLSTANDRIVAYYGNVDLSASAEGIDYPGVIIDGSNYFAYDTIPAWRANIVAADETEIIVGTQISYNSNVYIVTGNVSAPLFSDISSNVEQVSATKIDAIIHSRYSDNLGVDAGNIYIDGGKYVDTFSSHAPEELVPGRVFDSLDLRVFSNVDPDSNDYAFRIFDNLYGEHSFYRISDASTTTLSSDLLLTDNKIFVTDATVLPAPSRELGKPGYIFVNGERISFYRNYARESVVAWEENSTTNIIPEDTLTSFDGNIYLTLGNVYAPNVPWESNTSFSANSYFYYSGNTYQVLGNVRAEYFANIQSNTALVYNNENSGFATVSSNVTLIGDTVNVLGQIRRSAGGTSPSNVHVTGSLVADSGIDQEVPASTIASSTLATETTYLAVNNATKVTTVLWTTGPISVNNGDYIVQGAANVRVLSSVRNQSNVAVTLISGTVGASNVAVTISGARTAWTPNVVIPTSELITYSGDTYAVLGNVYGPSFGNALVSANVTLVNNASNFIANTRVLGTILSNGSVILSANTVVATGNVWYTSGAGTPTDGTGLLNSTTEQATFLKASPGYTP